MKQPKDSSQPDARRGSPLFPGGQLVPFILVTVLFFLWGIPNNLNDVLIRQFMKSFAISRFEAGLIQFAFYLGYFFLAMPVAIFMHRPGYKAGLWFGLLCFGTEPVSFCPGALV